MKKLVIFYPSDPLGARVGGITSYMKGLVQYAPADFDIEWIGISNCQRTRPPFKAVAQEIGKREFTFLPILFEADQNRRQLVPISLRYGLALRKLKRDWSRHLLFFHRIEPVLVVESSRNQNVALVHNDVTRQVFGSESESLWHRFPKIYRSVERAAVKRFAKVYSVSEVTVSYLKQSYPEARDKFTFVPTWVDPTVFKPIDVPKARVREDLIGLLSNLDRGRAPSAAEPWILFVGRLQAQKDPALLIRSFARYYERHQSGFLFLLGDGNLREDIVSLVESCSLADRVFITGAQQSSIVKQFYCAADLMVMTSVFEGMPIAVLEALACGLPVLSTDVGEVSRVVKHRFSGEIAATRSADTIAETMSQMLKRIGEYSPHNCRACVEAYTPQKLVPSMFEDFRFLLAGQTDG